MPIKNLDEIANLSIGVQGNERDKLLGLIASALAVAIDLVAGDLVTPRAAAKVSGRSLALAATAVIQSVNALLAAASVKCNLALPPEDIDMKLTGTGTLVYRCYHTPAHEWDLSGTLLP